MHHAMQALMLQKAAVHRAASGAGSNMSKRTFRPLALTPDRPYHMQIISCAKTAMCKSETAIHPASKRSREHRPARPMQHQALKLIQPNVCCAGSPGRTATRQGTQSLAGAPVKQSLATYLANSGKVGARAHTLRLRRTSAAAHIACAELGFLALWMSGCGPVHAGHNPAVTPGASQPHASPALLPPVLCGTFLCSAPTILCTPVKLYQLKG